MRCARRGEIGYPVAVKILSPDVAQTSDVGGVTLDLDTPEGGAAAAERMRKRLAELKPDARLEASSVQAMARNPEAHELIAGAATDPVFGPVILFGQGGLAVEVAGDHAVALPPLNAVLARELVNAHPRGAPAERLPQPAAGRHGRDPRHPGAGVAPGGRDPGNRRTRHQPAAGRRRGAIVLDARMRIAMADRSGSTLDRLAIRPYPAELEELVPWDGGELLLRPIRPEDGPAHVPSSTR
jgi:acetyltransferase